MSAPASLTPPRQEKVELLRALADRCEREGPNATLDGLIAAAAYGFDCIQIEDDSAGPRYYGYRGKQATELAPRMMRPFTTSLDAAKTLAPDGSWHVDVHDWTWSDAPCWCASFQRVQGGSAHVVAKAKTEAMARVAAALRARASEQEGQ